VTENPLGISNSWLISSQKESSCIDESQEFHFLADSTYWQHRNLRESYGSLMAYTGLSLSAGVYSWTRPAAEVREVKNIGRMTLF
jgi:hypothetical protein